MHNSFFPMHYKPVSTRPCQRPIERLERLLEELREMSDDERTDILKIQWLPTVEQVEYLLRPGLVQRDRIEALFVFHQRACGGIPPSMELIGTILGISRQRAYNYAKELVGQGRAKYERNRLRLVEGEYMHPLLKRFVER